MDTTSTQQPNGFLRTLGFLGLWMLAIGLVMVAQADAAQERAPASKLASARGAAGGKPTGHRKTTFDFEDGTVEALNKRPFDSATALSENEKGKKNNHLYKKRESFGAESAETLQQLRFE